MAGGGFLTRVLHPQLMFVLRALQRAPGAFLELRVALLGRNARRAKTKPWLDSNLYPSVDPN